MTKRLEKCPDCGALLQLFETRQGDEVDPATGKGTGALLSVEEKCPRCKWHLVDGVTVNRDPLRPGR